MWYTDKGVGPPCLSASHPGKGSLKGLGRNREPSQRPALSFEALLS
ncbi:hypothetical protein BACUNI_00035 [Bacteroides uniformis ATCC 8492]|uniref:Uncharacterized protein n=1 Tax=Bacteroides uniformis (strain ATCC 8492 / DSM 6597 / CCUG 4942 / CIP 103695 / JCM 5828 / KCTC 5204 / NCTC 13054 / VPI 0061) TaxID=411479 RepID=A0ABC9NHX9_BACUC|nr:hypothetical protein BACUNI_00035 [Bacteroides uniformis ATCC 8492]